jgi:hypothetical protein
MGFRLRPEPWNRAERTPAGSCPDDSDEEDEEDRLTAVSRRVLAFRQAATPKKLS